MAEASGENADVANSLVGVAFNVAIFGGAVVPLATGALADATGSLGTAMLLPALCYAVILAYGLYARRPQATA